MNQNKKLKGGAEKQRLKRQAELKVVAKDPKQKKLTFYSSSSSSLNNSVHHLTSNNYCQGKYRNNINNTVLYLLLFSTYNIIY